MKTLSTPLPVTQDSVIDSEYNEQTPNRRRKKKQYRKRSNHKHYYEDAWVEQWRYRYLTSTYDLVVSPIGYCPLCGRVSAPNYILVGLTSSKDPRFKSYRDRCAAGPQPGDKVFRTQKPTAGSGYMFIDDINLNDYYLKE